MMAEVPQDRIVDSYVYKRLRVLIVTSLEAFGSYYEFLHDQPTPDTFTQKQRADGGEYSHVWHQGHEMPAPP
jgi:hypothetical protein